LIKTEKGLPVSGFTFPKKTPQEACTVKSGETYLIRSTFKCTLLPGIYYVNVTALHFNDRIEKVPLNRITDAAVFQVQEEKNSLHWGIVNLEQVGEVKKLK